MTHLTPVRGSGGDHPLQAGLPADFTDGRRYMFDAAVRCADVCYCWINLTLSDAAYSGVRTPQVRPIKRRQRVASTNQAAAKGRMLRVKLGGGSNGEVAQMLLS